MNEERKIDEKYMGFWISRKLLKKVEKKLEQRRKDSEPYTFRAFMLSLIKNAVE